MFDFLIFSDFRLYKPQTSDGFEEGIFVTTLWKRMYVLVTSDDDCGLDVDPNAARRFVLLQLLVLAAGWALNVSPAGLAFPLVIAALVPIRAYLLPRLFTSRQLMILDDEEQHRLVKEWSIFCCENVVRNKILYVLLLS